MQELLLGALQEVPDGTLGNSILGMRIDPAEGELLLVLLACLLECIVRKSTIVAMVVFDGYAVLGGELLKCFLCFIVLSGNKSCIRCTYHRQEKWSMKMDAARYRLEVSLPFSWAKIPTCVDIM
jgi:hypothetical protein